MLKQGFQLDLGGKVHGISILGLEFNPILIVLIGPVNVEKAELWADHVKINFKKLLSSVVHKAQNVAIGGSCQKHCNTFVSQIKCE